MFVLYFYVDVLEVMFVRAHRHGDGEVGTFVLSDCHAGIWGVKLFIIVIIVFFPQHHCSKWAWLRWYCSNVKLESSCFFRIFIWVVKFYTVKNFRA